MSPKNKFNDAAKPAPGELIAAAKREDVVKVKELLARGADPNEKDEEGCTPLLWATYKNNNSVTAALLESPGILVNEANNAGVRPVMETVCHGNLGMTESLLERGADPDGKALNNCTSLMFATHRRDLPMVRLLLDWGATVSLRSNDHQSALDVAVKEKYTEIAHLLVEAATTPQAPVRKPGAIEMDHAAVSQKQNRLRSHAPKTKIKPAA